MVIMSSIKVNNNTNRTPVSRGSPAVVVNNSHSTGGPFIIPTQVLDDLSTRFIINIPKEDREDMIRVCFQLELAHWHYLDLICDQHQHLPRLNFTRFCHIIFQHIPFLRPHYPSLEPIINRWREYKLLVPTCGAILLDPSLEHLLLVQGFGGRSWGFPKGKINEEEPYVMCAVREVREETAYDCAHTIDDQCFIERTVNEKTVRLYIVKDVSKEFPFRPLARNEIKDIKWFPVDDLPVRTAAQQSEPNAMTGTPGTPSMKVNHFYTVCPFVKPLRRWIAKERRKQTVCDHQTRRDKEANTAGQTSHESDLFWAKSWDNIKFDWDNIWRDINRDSVGVKV